MKRFSGLVWDRGSVMVAVLVGLIATAVILRPNPAQAGNELGTDTQKSDSNRVSRKLPAAELSEEKLPGLSDFVAVKTMPVPIYSENPAYPQAAEKGGIEGEIWIKALVDKNGLVAETQVHNEAKVNADLAQAARDAAKDCRYKPATGEDGKPVAIWVSYKVVFELDDCKRDSSDDVD